jgi:hypothetical protein
MLAVGLLGFKEGLYRRWPILEFDFFPRLDPEIL